jgi:uncharacterized tellurite resistance protein B-like protein
MLDGIRSFFSGRLAPAAADREADEPAERDRVRLAACALLVELACADGDFAPVERAHIEGALIRHFGVAPDAVRELITLAEEENRRAVDHYQFTRLIAGSYDIGQKMVLAEVMWGLIAADGKTDDQEAYLVRKISNLLDLEPGYLYEAKKRATAS